jgi:hypothetical protein
VTPDELQARQADNYSRSRRSFDLSPDRENVLWQNYLNETCTWVRN